MILNGIIYQKYVKSKKIVKCYMKSIQDYHDKSLLYRVFQNKYQNGSPNWKMAEDFNNNDVIFISFNKLSIT